MVIEPNLPPAPSNPAAGTPPRRPGSVRRTSTIDMTWPGGRGTQLHLAGRARDLLTTATSEPVSLAADAMWVGVGADRSIAEIHVEPARAGIDLLIGARAGGKLRSALAETLPDEAREGTPLWLLLDDIAGASLIAGFAWSRHLTDWMKLYVDKPPDDDAEAQRAAAAAKAARRPMEGICAGFRPGSSALADDGTSVGRQNVVPVGDLGAADDPLGWHEREALPAVAMRRARRIDVWNEPGEIHVDAMFRDTAHDPGGYEVAVHEYRLTAVADSATRCLVDVTAEPRVLPYPECPAAAGNVGRLVGQPLATLRSTVLAMLRSTDSCTHLNDALRSLAEVPTLAAALDHAG